MCAHSDIANLEAEFFTALRRMRQLDADPWPFVGITRIEVSGRTYQPEPSGFTAFIVPEVNNSEIVDLVAWKPDRPNRWWQRTGNAAVLGADNLEVARLNEPPKVYPTPERWVIAGKGAIVLLDGDVDRLLEFPDAECDSESHRRKVKAEVIRRALARLPKFKVRADA
jgi:hypothetical protein